MQRRADKFKATVVLTTILMASSSCGRREATANTNAAPAPNTSTSANDVAANNLVQAARFTDDELDELFARIALYPDPILAQMIPAATYVDQLKEASTTLKGSTDDDLISKQNWDISVKSVAHYPRVLKTMLDDEEWTVSVGQAYVNQPSDVAKSIQRLRSLAKAAGNLQTTSQQQVIEQNGMINIEPAQPKTIYVPEYNSETVYVEQQSGVSTGTAVAMTAVSFGAGLLIGSWLNNDYDYYGRGIYYHGWVGPGWVGVNRTFVNVNNNYYVNNSFRNVNVNRNIVNRNVNTYRTNLTRNSVVRRERVNNARVRNDLDRNRGQASLPRSNVAGRDLNRNAADRSNIADRNRTSSVSNRKAAPRAANAGNRSTVQRPAATRTTQTRQRQPQRTRSGGGRRSR